MNIVLTSVIILTLLTVIISIVYFVLFDALFNEHTIKLTTHSGAIRGITLTTLIDKRQFFAFRGIPYAKPPIGSLRFKAPEAVEPWNYTIRTTDYENICLQILKLPDEFVGSEDCLYLNVFTPNLAPVNGLPVIVYIHGGAYTQGSAKWAGPEILLDEDVILVTIQYRLGPLGFLALQYPEYSGNMGLKDQQVGLRWVHENIHAFGGNREKITIYGHSAGASSINFQMFSPQSQGLFQRAILSGGSMYNQFAYVTKNVNHTDILLTYLSNHWNQPKDQINEEEIRAWLTLSDVEDFIIHSSKRFYTSGLRSKSIDIIWAPVIEDLNAIKPFMVVKPEEYLNTTCDLDTLIGFTSAEAIGFVGLEIGNPENLLSPFNEHFEIQAPLAPLQTNFSSELYKNYSNDVRRFYFGYKNATRSTLNEYIQLLSDIFITYAVDKFAKQQAIRSSGKTFYFEFDIELGLNYFRDRVQTHNNAIRGSAHAEDYLYIFKSDLLPYEIYQQFMDYESDEKRFIKLFRRFIVDFVTYGDPSASNRYFHLKPISKNEMPYVKFRNDGIETSYRSHADAFKFWDDTLEKYKDILYVTSDEIEKKIGN